MDQVQYSLGCATAKGNVFALKEVSGGPCLFTADLANLSELGVPLLRIKAAVTWAVRILPGVAEDLITLSRDTPLDLRGAVAGSSASHTNRCKVLYLAPAHDVLLSLALSRAL